MFSFVNKKKSNHRREGKKAEARRPRLERRNAAKNIDYEASCTSSDESTSLQTSRSLDFSPVGYSSQSSFRIGGSIEGEVEHLYQSLGLSGPEDFAIPIAAWEASLKFRSSSDVLPRSRFLESEDPCVTADLAEEANGEAALLGEDAGVRPPGVEEAVVLEEISVGDEGSAEDLWSSVRINSCGDGGITGNRLPVLPAPTPAVSVPSSAPAISVRLPTISTTLPVAVVIKEEIEDRHAVEIDVLLEENRIRDEEVAGIQRSTVGRSGRVDVGIKGTRPPVLTPPPLVSVLSTSPVRSLLPPPPSMALPVHDRASSTWDIVKSFAPSDENEISDRRRSFGLDVQEDEEDDESVGSGEAGEALESTVMEGETSDGTGSFSTSIDDDSSSTTTEFVISPNGRFKKKIRSWMRGHLLGSGSFGTVYEGISDDGTFIAVKEVSLLDKGSNAQQCILQLEQEIALLSQFEHENIVQYYGTDKEESKLYIFLELVTQGSIASLYQKYHLRDTQVSSYTRQILNGLNYLHERDVVHRDIKCANILVHANGSIKLADFGLAKEISKFNDLKSCKGSVYWMAPEVVHPRKTYGRAADIWSLGCTVLEMLTRQIPYPNVEWQHAFYRIGRGDQPPIPNHLSSDAQDFIRKCVQVDPNARPTAAQLLEHPFITRRPLETY
ncbi:mitogen-activated protein kinase kinase kinase 1-like [Phalaenopsis equestris]|uniref:mitogen-activated protein kinase kinase kinase 1-like n=1 Tax=Phalaenopsis equestris TaxID=78828 RepID=UPI0009E35A4A|nr:mitogen-activated protein kinase kinase kinase 1-like [Phalaenopsis equestris]